MSNVSTDVMEQAKKILAEVLLIPDETEDAHTTKVKAFLAELDEDDDMNEPLGERCLIDDPDCESCQ